MTENARLMVDARNALEGRWGIAIGTFFLYSLFTVGQMIPVLGWVGGVLVGGSMAVGISIFSLALARGEEVRVEQLFEGFRKFEKAMGAYVLMVLFILPWLLLFIIPGIIRALDYSQTFFILADDDDIDAIGALRKSEAMMNGYKWKYLFLSLRFLGWGILCMFTLGIGFLWLVPYMQISYANFYDDLRSDIVDDEGFIKEDILDSDLV